MTRLKRQTRDGVDSGDWWSSPGRLSGAGGELADDGLPRSAPPSKPAPLRDATAVGLGRVAGL